MDYINKLSEGMTKDFDPSLQPPNTYRHGLNGNLISKGGNHYAFEAVDGTRLAWTMPEHKTGANKFMPIGWFRLGERLVVHSTDEKGLPGGDGEIGLVTFNSKGIGTYEAVYYHADLRYTQARAIGHCGYGIEENDAYHRGYWTDDYNQPRTLNFASPILTTNIASGSLVVGQSYMVLTNSVGSITYAGTVYGPKQAAGNIFTATSLGGTVYATSGFVKVIKLLNPNILNYTPQKTIGSIDFVQYTGGALNCGVKLYAYLLSTLDGYESSWTFTTNPIHVGPDAPGAGYQQYQGAGGGVNSNKGIILSISNIPEEFDKIKVVVIEIGSAYNVITNIEVFWDSEITGETMQITHVGGENLEALTIDDLSLTTAVITRVKDLTTVKQRQIILNLTEREEIDITASATATPFNYEIPADKQGLVTHEFNTTLCTATGISSGSIFPGGHYVVRSDTASDTIVYNGVSYAVGDTFVGIDGITTYTPVGTAPIVRGCIRIKQYETAAGVPVYKVIDLMDEYFDYKSMASHMYLRSHFRDETYRFAYLFLDLFGNPFFVRYGNDVTIPSQSDASGDFKLLNNYSGDTKFTLNAIGVEFDGLDITDIRDQISGVMIVRVPRDKQILGQGLLWPNVPSYDFSGTLIPNVLVPIGAAQTTDDFNVSQNTGTAEFIFGAMGPEFDFDLSVFNIGLAAGDVLRPVSEISPIGGAVVFASDGIAEQRISKYYTHNDYDPRAGSEESQVSRIDFFDVNGGPTTIGSNTFKNHDIALVDAYGHKVADGGRRTVFTINDNDFYTTTNFPIGTGTFGTTNRRLLVNYVRPKSSASLYGGTTDVAKAANLYIPTGHYLRIDDALLSSIVDPSGRYILNGMQVFGGDAFVCLYDRCTSVFDARYDSGGNPISNGSGSYSYGIIFPVESEINVGLREGRHMSLDGMHNNPNGVVFDYAGSRRDEAFSYSPAYSSENSQITYPSLPVDFRSVSRFPYMARYSQQKNLGEAIDNMRIFLLNNFKNADALHGEIVNGEVAFDRLFYWQNKGIGYFPVEERESITGTLGQAVQLGVGGTMQRYDTIHKFYGNQHKLGMVRTENGWCWFDMRRKALMRMNYNGQAVDFSVIKGLQGFFAEKFDANNWEDLSAIFTTDQPLLGNGITGVYDARHKLILMTFKFSDEEDRDRANFDRICDFTIGIAAQLDKFVGEFSFTPAMYIEHDNQVYAVQETRFNIIGGMDYEAGMVVSKNGVNYLCIQDFTTSFPVVAIQEPDVVGSLYWTAINNESQVEQYWEGDVCKFHGAVYPYELEVVSNDGVDVEKGFDNIELYGNDKAITDVYYETSKLTASDTNIESTNKDFELVDNSWWFSVALADGGERLVDHYMKIKVVDRNYDTDRTTSNNEAKRVVYVRSVFRPKM